jgi:hypothetical protein
MQLELKDEDFAEGVEKEYLANELRNSQAILGDEAAEKHEAIMNAVPKALAKRLREIIPDGFTIKEIQVNVSFSGKPFGIGVSGDALVKLGPVAGK